MSTDLIPVDSLDNLPFRNLIPKADTPLTPSQQALVQMCDCFNGLWVDLPIEARDFLLRSLRSFGLPLDYPELPFWTAKVARHVFTLCYPTLRKCDLSNPTPETLGRLIGHILAISRQAEYGGAAFDRLFGAGALKIREFFMKLSAPTSAIVTAELARPIPESSMFLRGMNHSFGRTFDTMGWPIGWNTSSPIQIAICVGWRYIAETRPSLPTLHRELLKTFGHQIVGNEERVKKLCHRLGLRFDGAEFKESKGTSRFLNVPSGVGTTLDKKGIAQSTSGDSND